MKSVIVLAVFLKEIKNQRSLSFLIIFPKSLMVKLDTILQVFFVTHLNKTKPKNPYKTFCYFYDLIYAKIIFGAVPRTLAWFSGCYNTRYLFFGSTKN